MKTCGFQKPAHISEALSEVAVQVVRQAQIELLEAQLALAYVFNSPHSGLITFGRISCMSYGRSAHSASAYQSSPQHSRLLVLLWSRCCTGVALH